MLPMASRTTNPQAAGSIPAPVIELQIVEPMLCITRH
jgi:hypothetical protein